MDRDAGAAHVIALRESLSPIFDEVVMRIEPTETFGDVQLSVVDPLEGGVSFFVAATVRGPSPLDDEVRAVALRVRASCP